MPASTGPDVDRLPEAVEPNQDHRSSGARDVRAPRGANASLESYVSAAVAAAPRLTCAQALALRHLLQLEPAGFMPVMSSADLRTASDAVELPGGSCHRTSAVREES